MRRRRWVVVLATLIIAILPISFLGLKIASRHPAVKRAVLGAIMPGVRGRVSIGELEVGLASLSLTDVIVDLGENGSVFVPSATVSLSYPKLLTRGFDARRALSTVIVSGPRISIRYGGADDATTGPGTPLDLDAVGKLVPDYLGVSDATLVLEDVRTGRSVEVRAIDLLLRRTGDVEIEGGAVGSCLGGAENLSAELRWDLAADSLSIEAELSDADLGAGGPLPRAASLDVVSGGASALLLVTVGPAGDGSLAAEFALDDVELVLPGDLGRLEGASGAGAFDGATVTFSLSEGHWRGAGLVARGSVDVRGKTVTSLDVRAVGVSLESLAGLMREPMAAVEGVFDIEATVRGPFDDLAAAVKGSAPAAGVGGVELRGVSIEGTYASGGIEIGLLRAGVFGGDVWASGSLRPGRDEAPWELDLEGEAGGIDLGEFAAAFGVASASGTLSLQGLEVRGTPDRPEIECLLSFDAVTLGPVTLGCGGGGFLLRDDTLTAAVRSTDSAYAVSGQIERLRSEGAVDAEVVLCGLRVDSLFALPGDTPLPVWLDGTLDVSGPADSLSFGGVLAATGAEGHATLEIAGALERGSEGRELRFSLDAPDAVVRGIEIPFSADVAADARELVVSPVDVSGVGEARIRVGLGDERRIEASLVVSEASLPDVIALATGARCPASIGGLLFASVSVQGTLEEPTATAQLQLGNGRAVGVTGLDAALVASLAGGEVDVREFVLRQDGHTVATASGTAVLGGEIAMSVRGEGIPGPLLGGDDDSGFDLTLGIGGRTDAPTFDGRLESSDGTFLGVPFDEFVARVTGAQGLVRIDPLALEREGSYRVSVVGRLPYGFLGGDTAEECALTIEVDGDPIALLVELVPFADSAGGTGRMRIDLAGTREDATIVSAHLDAWASSIEPTVLFEELTDVHASLTVADGVVVDGRIEGLVDGRPIRLESRRGAFAGGRMLTPLVVGGLDVGVLALSTGAEGVRATVPGLMLPDDVGRVTVCGAGGQPAFLVGGPSDRPSLHGEMEFSDASFTYPFLSTGRGFGAGFFSRAEWSVRMTAGRNLWYWRPDANLKLERGGYLDLVGTPADGTLCVSGRIESNRGTVTYLDTDFDAREVFVDFPLFCEPPRFHVEAATRVEDGTTITLTMNSFEDAFLSAAPGVTLDESALVLASDSPDDNTQEKILSRLQYGVSYELLESKEQAALGRRRAIEVVGSQISGLVVRPLLSPVEGAIRRELNLDLVRFEVDFIEQVLAELDQWYAQEGTGGYQPFFVNTGITLGKYISRDWLLSYVGLLESYEEDLGDERLGLQHELGIEYEVSRNTSLSMRVVYDQSLAGWDRRISIENRYQF